MFTYEMFGIPLYASLDGLTCESVNRYSLSSFNLGSISEIGAELMTYFKLGFDQLNKLVQQLNLETTYRLNRCA